MRDDWQGGDITWASEGSHNRRQWLSGSGPQEERGGGLSYLLQRLAALDKEK